MAETHKLWQALKGTCRRTSCVSGAASVSAAEEAAQGKIKKKQKKPETKKTARHVNLLMAIPKLLNLIYKENMIIISGHSATGKNSGRQ